MNIRFLEEVSRRDVGTCGGKGASLGEMLGAGLPVPNGFVITTEAYIAGVSDGLEKEILGAFDRLDAGRVAVRSSAIAEDSLEASWAGQLESYLNVTKDRLIKAVEDCWHSIESGRAAIYANEHNVPRNARAVAVVIQSMVDSEIAGVMFTANPVTSNRGELMIEAAYGLGEMIVQGMVTPESIVLDKNTHQVISRAQHSQESQLIYKDGNNIEVAVGPDFQKKDILTSKQIRELLELAAKIEKHYGSPQDIEWAINDDKIYITQSRPITTLKV